MAFATVTLINATLGTDVETGQTTTGTETAKFRCVVNTKRGDTEIATWYSVEVYGAQARGVATLARMGHLGKGKRACITGKLVGRPYTDRTGAERTSLDVTATEVEPIWEPRAEITQDGGVLQEVPF